MTKKEKKRTKRQTKVYKTHYKNDENTQAL